MIRRSAVGVVALAAIIGLAACSGSVGSSTPTSGTATDGSSAPAVSDTSASGASGPSSSSAGPGTTTRPVTIISVNVQPGTATGYVGALADVTGLKCESKNGEWTASGRVTNGTDKLVSYRIYVSLLDATHRTRAVYEVDAERVAPRTSQLWQGKVRLAATDLTCVLRVERSDVG